PSTRAEQLVHGKAEGAAERERDPQRGIGVARLDRRDRLAGYPGHAGQLLLREPAHLAGQAQLGPGSAASVPRVRGHARTCADHGWNMPSAPKHGGARPGTAASPPRTSRHPPPAPAPPAPPPPPPPAP